jgi:hypothetical protein
MKYIIQWILTTIFITTIVFAQQGTTADSLKTINDEKNRYPTDQLIYFFKEPGLHLNS